MKPLLTFLLIFSILTVGTIASNSSIKPESKIRYEEALKLLDAGDFKEAGLLFKEVHQKNTLHLDTLINLTKISIRSNKLDEAEKYVVKALKIAPQEARVQHLIGQVYGLIASDASFFTALDYANGSLKGFTEAVRLEPENIDYRLGLISYHLSASTIAGGDKNIALQQAKIIKKLDLKKGFLTLSDIYITMDDKESLQRHYSDIDQKLAKDPEILYQKGLFAQTRQEFVRATTSFQQAIRFSEEDDEFLVAKFGSIYQLGKTSILSEERLEYGIAAFENYIRQAPDSMDLPSKQWAKFRRANLLSLGGDKEQAKSIYEKLVENTTDKQLIEEIRKIL